MFPQAQQSAVHSGGQQDGNEILDTSKLFSAPPALSRSGPTVLILFLGLYAQFFKRSHIERLGLFKNLALSPTPEAAVY